ncbi:hypothetical protein AMTRI_Chr02g218570 [Amborella trichopoda]
MPISVQATTFGGSRAHIQTSRLPTTYPVGEAHAACGGSEAHIETNGLPTTSVIGEAHAACCGNSGHSIHTYYAGGGTGLPRPLSFCRNMAYSIHLSHDDSSFGGRGAYNQTSEPPRTSLAGEDDATCDGSSFFPSGGHTSYDNTAHTSHASATTKQTLVRRQLRMKIISFPTITA